MTSLSPAILGWPVFRLRPVTGGATVAVGLRGGSLYELIFDPENGGNLPSVAGG